ncbi:YdgA family protein [Gammaproteobacteria bacterium]|nr:YdgA family protein [Gammaproteobacteria bacterium]
MKKPVLIIILALVLVSPYLIAFSSKSRIEGYVAFLDNMPGYTAAIEEYQSGYLHSTATVRLGLDTEILGQSLDSIETIAPFVNSFAEGSLFKINITHGPILPGASPLIGLFHADIALASNPDYIEELKATLGVDALLETELTMGLFGSGQLSFTAPAFQLNIDDDENNLNFGGMNIVYSLGDYGRTYELEGELKPITLTSLNQDNTKHANIGPILLTGFGDFSEGFLLGTGEFALDIVSVSFSDGNTSGTIEHFIIGASVTNPAPSTLSVGYHFNIGHLESSDQDMTIDNLVLDFSLNNLNKEGLIEFYETMGEFVAIQDPEAMQDQVMNSISKIYSENPEFEIKQLSFLANDSASFNLSGALGINSDAFPDSTLMLDNPFELIANLTARLNLNFNEGFLAFSKDSYIRRQYADRDLSDAAYAKISRQQQLAFDTSIAEILAAGYIIKNGADYSLSATMIEGNLVVNGDPVPLPF